MPLQPKRQSRYQSCHRDSSAFPTCSVGVNLNKQGVLAQPATQEEGSDVMTCFFHGLQNVESTELKPVEKIEPQSGYKLIDRILQSREFQCFEGRSFTKHAVNVCSDAAHAYQHRCSYTPLERLILFFLKQNTISILNWVNATLSCSYINGSL